MTMTTIYRYIFMGFVPPLLINLLFFTFVFLMGQLLKITKLINLTKRTITKSKENAGT